MTKIIHSLASRTLEFASELHWVTKTVNKLAKANSYVKKQEAAELKNMEDIYITDILLCKVYVFIAWQC